MSYRPACCQTHPCDSCGWCTGALNGGVPICCLTVATTTDVATTHRQSDLDVLREAIAADQADQPSLSELLLAEAMDALVHRVLASDPIAEPVPVPAPHTTTRRTPPGTPALPSAAQPALPPASPPASDLLSQRQPEERKQSS